MRNTNQLLHEDPRQRLLQRLGRQRVRYRVPLPRMPSVYTVSQPLTLSTPSAMNFSTCPRLLPQSHSPSISQLYTLFAAL